MPEHGLSVHRDSEHLSNTAARSVGADDVARSHVARLIRPAIEDGRDHVIAELFEVDELCVEAELRRWSGSCVREENRLEDVLRRRAAERRAPTADALGDHRLDEPALDDLSREAMRRDHVARIGEGDVAHRLLDSDLPEDLHRPRVDESRLRIDRRPGVLLDQQRGDAVMTQEDRGAQSHRTPPTIKTGISAGRSSSRSVICARRA